MYSWLLHAQQSCSPDNPDTHSTRVEIYHPGTIGVRDSPANPCSKCLSFSSLTALLGLCSRSKWQAVGHQGAATNHWEQELSR